MITLDGHDPGRLIILVLCERFRFDSEAARSLNTALWDLFKEDGFSAKEVDLFLEELENGFSKLQDEEVRWIALHLLTNWNVWMQLSEPFRLNISCVKDLVIERMQKMKGPTDEQRDTLWALKALELPLDDQSSSETAAPSSGKDSTLNSAPVTASTRRSTGDHM